VPREPLLLPVAALALGILTAHFYYFILPDLWVPLLLTAVVLGVSFRFTTSRFFRWTSVGLAMALAGMVSQTTHRQERTPKLTAEDGETVLLSGCVINPPVFSPDREQFTLNLSHNSTAAIRLSVDLKGKETLPLRYGEQVELPAKIRLPRNFQNPGAFDYSAYLAGQHIYWTGSVSNLTDVKTRSLPCGSKLLAALFSIRTWALERIARLYPGDQQTSALLQATLLGETSGVERRWTSDFRTTGTYHALVISGLHISVLAYTLLLLLRVMQVRRIPALGIAAVVCWLYAFLSGFNAPAVRAAAAFSLFLIASYCFRKTRILNIIGVIGIGYLLLDPDQLFDPAFQLSFLSAAAIGAFAIPAMERVTDPLRASVKRFDQTRYDPQVEARAAQWRVELRLLAETLRICTGLPLSAARWAVAKGALFMAFAGETAIVSASMQFALALPLIAYFHRLSFTGISANMIVVPLLSLVVPLGFASILTGSHLLALLTKLTLHWAEWVAAWHVRLEPAWRQGAIPFWIAAAFAVSLLVLGVAIRRRRWVAAVSICSLALFGIVTWQPWRPLLQPGWLELTAIDVSQGDSLLLVFPDGETMLVDAGGFPGMERMRRKPKLDMGEDVVSPYLWDRRIRRLNYAVLTHGHSDHAGGLAAVLDNFRPHELWTGAEPETPAWQTIRQHARNDGVRILPLNRTSAPVTIGGAHVRILAPAPDYVAGDNPANDDSLVMEIRFGRRSILLTGDAESPEEQSMLDSGELQPVTLLKVGHHGSKTSSSEEFLSQVAPRFAIISDGYKNQFHHPHPMVLQRLAQHHAVILRTDEEGLITFRTDGDKVEYETFH
jgi:competence protein ComEC